VTDAVAFITSRKQNCMQVNLAVHAPGVLRCGDVLKWSFTATTTALGYCIASLVTVASVWDAYVLQFCSLLH
jgi:hypothetical protein